MEVKFSHVSGLGLEDLSFLIPSGKITGIYGKDGIKLLKLISLQEEAKGIIYFNKIRKLRRNYYLFRNEIVLVKEKFVNEFFLDNVYEYFVYYIKYYKIKVNNINKKIKDAVRLVGFSVSVLERRFSTLTSSEIKRLNLSLALLSNPKVLLLEEPFRGYDLFNRKRIARILNKLQEKYQKTIVIASSDPNTLYQYTNYLIVLHEGKKVLEGASKEVFFESDFFSNKTLERPAIVDFISLVNEKKGLNLPRRSDVKDVIKDIYWNV